MPGCVAYTSPDALAFVVGAANTATCTLLIPGASTLVGFHFQHQAIVLDPGAGNALGAWMSDAAVAVVGS